MDVSSVQKLCIHLISAAFQRCRVSDDLCRLSIVLRCCSSAPDPPIVRISISDTGIGSSLEEFQDLNFGREIIDAEKWGISDDEIYHYHLNLRESISARRLTRLPSNPKSVCLSTSESIDVFLTEFNSYFRKMLILKIPNVAIESVVEREDVPGSRSKDVFLANECNPLPFSSSNVERLKSGLEDYVLKHRNTLQGMCDSCFPSWEHLKVGNGVACCTETQRNSGMLMEVIIIISELSENISCIRECGAKTEICSYAPDLARSITGLILSSNDSEFQGECLTLLGLQSQHIDGETVEGCINEKIVSVIEMNDRKPRKSREVAAPFLFEDDGLQELNLQDEEYDTGEHLFNSLDLF
ncbi:hypothetical protein QYF36_026396 [Acer negundo]|nr:hypothetical protein QYF36_026396 [Acer negundo]